MEIFSKKDVCLGRVLDVNEAIYFHHLSTQKPHKKNIHSKKITKNVDENTLTILKGLGLSDKEIQHLANDEVI